MKTSVEITNGKNVLRGMLNKPDIQGKMPLALFFHGFTGQKVESHCLFAKMADALEKQGIASLRFDFAGSGDSDGDFCKMTFASELSDAQAILEYAKSLDFTDNRHIYLIGLSMGGAVAGVLASRNNDDVAKLCLWSGAGDLYETLKTFVTLVNGEFAFDENNQIDVFANMAGRQLFDEARETDVFALSSGFTKDVLLIRGGRDPVVPRETTDRYKALYGDRAQMHILPESGHTYDRAVWETEVISKTVSFLKY